MLIVYYIYTLLFCVETNLRCNVGNLHTTLEHFTKYNFFQKLFMCINSEIVWSKPVLTLPEIHYWHFQASIQHLETKLKKRANLCLPMCLYHLYYSDMWLCTGFQRLKMYYANPWTLHTLITINCNNVNSAASSGNYWLLRK